METLLSLLLLNPVTCRVRKDERMNWKTDILLIGQDKIESHILQVSSIDKEYAGMPRVSL